MTTVASAPTAGSQRPEQIAATRRLFAQNQMDEWINQKTNNKPTTNMNLKQAGKRSQVQISKMGKPAQAETGESRQMAPLASLDCSISEPVAGRDQEPGASGSTPTDTPTLSGYFDCDQLSDMVDGSLFEITNAGCLSKSVFNSAQRNTSSSRKFVNPELVEEPEEAASQQATSARPEVRPPLPSEASQVKIITNRQPYDYSSSSAIPAALLNSNSKAARLMMGSAGSGGARQRPSTRKSTSGNQARNSRQPEGVVAARRSKSNLELASGETRCKICQQEVAELARKAKKAGKRKFAFNLFNLFTNATAAGPIDSDDKKSKFDKKKTPTAKSCPHQRHQAAGEDHKSNHHQQLSGSSSSGCLTSSLHQQPAGAVGGGVSRANVFGSDEQPSKGIVVKRRFRQQEPPAGASASASAGRARQASGSGGLASSRPRDSIRITNQRKLRSSGNNTAVGLMKLTTTNMTNKEEELLLDFATNSINNNAKQANRIRLSQSSHTLSRSNSNNNPQDKQKQTKSVKFTMPDKVMLMGGPQSAVLSSFGAGAKLARLNGCPATTTTDLQPIIKRQTNASSTTTTTTIPRSSSYTQTELNRSLEEMLAKYERNNELIMELSEKLKLTETIASPMSALDRLPQSDYHDNNNYITSLTGGSDSPPPINAEPDDSSTSACTVEAASGIAPLATNDESISLIGDYCQRTSCRSDPSSNTDNNNNNYINNNDASLVSRKVPPPTNDNEQSSHYQRRQDQISSSSSNQPIPKTTPDAVEEAGVSLDWLGQQRAIV